MNSIEYYLEDMSKETIDQSNSFEKQSLYFNIFIIVFSFSMSAILSIFIIKKIYLILNEIILNLDKKPKIISNGAFNLQYQRTN